jgi:hypothetical protein
MIKISIGFVIILGVALVGADPASARLKVYYENFGYCPDTLTPVTDIAHCRKRPTERHMCPPGTCSRTGARDALYLKHCVAENCRH